MSSWAALALVEELVSKGLKGVLVVFPISGRNSRTSNMAASGIRVSPVVKARDLIIFAGGSDDVEPK